MQVKKASGDLSNYSAEKLRKSLLHSGAKPARIEEIIAVIDSKLYHGITTKEIYRLAFSMLKKTSKTTACRYKLKEAIMELGPSGFPFEKYVGEIFKLKGYQVQVGVLVMGKCVKHEVDVIAEKDNIVHFMECKFHNRRGINCDVKIPLYVHSRFRDIESALSNTPEYAHKQLQGWVVTNTQFSDDAIKYGTCAGLNLLGWDFPDKHSLREIIDHAKLYPITCLSTLTQGEKFQLLEKKIVLCKELASNVKVLQNIGITNPRLSRILQEAADLV